MVARRKAPQDDDASPDARISALPVDDATEQPAGWAILVGLGGLLWLLVLGWACWLNYMDPLPIPRKVAHPLRAFDSVFRVAGPLLPFCVVVPRAFVPLPSFRGSPARTVGLYVYMTLVRLVLYLAGDFLAPKTIADHVLLGSAVYSMLCSEALAVLYPLLVNSKAMPTNSRQTGHVDVFNRAVRMCRMALFLLASALAVLVAWDLFYTARYFHRVHETAYSVIVGLCVFQIPLAWYAFTLQEAKLWPTVKPEAE